MSLLPFQPRRGGSDFPDTQQVAPRAILPVPPHVGETLREFRNNDRATRLRQSVAESDARRVADAISTASRVARLDGYERGRDVERQRMRLERLYWVGLGVAIGMLLLAAAVQLGRLAGSL